MEEKLLKKYLEQILDSDLSNRLIQKEKFELSLIDYVDDKEYVTEANVVTLEKLKTIQLVTKLETLIKIFEILKDDLNVVFCDEMIEEYKGFKDKILPKIEEVIKSDEGSNDII